MGLLPQLKLVETIPSGLDRYAIEDAVASFVREAHIPEEHQSGLYNQTIESIAGSLVVKIAPNQRVWIAEKEGKVHAYALGHIAKDVDNQLCLWLTQAWVHKQYRHTFAPKVWFDVLREHGKKSLCKHIVIPSSRGSKGYCRFLGKNWQPYLTLLKEDI